MNLAQNVCLDDFQVEFETRSPGSKTRSPGQICRKRYHSSGHIFQAIIINLAQHVCLDDF